MMTEGTVIVNLEEFMQAYLYEKELLWVIWGD